MLFSGEISEEDVAARIRASAIPSIMQPSKIYKVDSVPVLGTGKVDFKSSKKLAAQLVAGEGNLDTAEEA
jgi:2-acyl-glycerophospho-ethanolamine acyltransferase